MTEALKSPFRKGDAVSASKLDAMRRGVKAALTMLPRDGILSSLGVVFRRSGTEDISYALGVNPCQVYLDGGTTSGNASATCDRTYSIYSLSGTFVASGLTPVKPRPLGLMKCVSSGGASASVDPTRLSLYCSYLSGETTVYKLLDALEIYATFFCEVASG